MSIYNKATFGEYFHKGLILTPLNHFIKDLEPSFCGKYIPHLLDNVKNDMAMFFRLNGDIHLLGMLKESHCSNNASAYHIDICEYFGNSLWSFP